MDYQKCSICKGTFPFQLESMNFHYFGKLKTCNKDWLCYYCFRWLKTIDKLLD